MPRAFHATQEPTGEIRIGRVNPVEGVQNAFTFKDAAEMRDALSESYTQDDLDLLFHELAKAGSLIFHVGSLKARPQK